MSALQWLAGVRIGAILGACLGGVYSSFAIVAFLLGSQAFDKPGQTLGAVVAVFFGLGIMGGAAVGAARPLARGKISGRIVSSLAIVAGVSPLAAIGFGSPVHWGLGLVDPRRGTSDHNWLERRP